MVRINRKAASLAALGVAALLGAAACAGPAPASNAAAPPSTSDSMSGMTAPATTADTAPVRTNTVRTNTVSIKNFAFSPATVTVSVGTTVTWTNDDQDAHTVTATDHTFGSQPMNPGATYHFTFTKPGTYSYLCTIHPFMTATVVVTK